VIIFDIIMEPEEQVKKTYPCQYCGKVLNSENYLIRHQKQTLTCLKLQNRKPDALTCPWCKEKTYFTRATYNHHLRECKEKKLCEIRQNNEKLEAENLAHKAEIASLQAKLSQAERELITLRNEIILSKKSK